MSKWSPMGSWNRCVLPLHHEWISLLSLWPSTFAWKWDSDFIRNAAKGEILKRQEAPKFLSQENSREGQSGETWTTFLSPGVPSRQGNCLRSALLWASLLPGRRSLGVCPVSDWCLLLDFSSKVKVFTPFFFWLAGLTVFTSHTGASIPFFPSKQPLHSPSGKKTKDTLEESNWWYLKMMENKRQHNPLFKDPLSTFYGSVG